MRYCSLKRNRFYRLQHLMSDNDFNNDDDGNTASGNDGDDDANQ